MKQWMKRASAAVLAGLALSSGALAAGTEVPSRTNVVPPVQKAELIKKHCRLD